MVHKRLQELELRVLERPGPSMDITTFKKDLSRSHYNVDVLLAQVEAVL